MFANSNPLTGAINGLLGMGNLAIGAYNEANPYNSQSGALMTTDTVGADSRYSDGMTAADGSHMAGGNTGVAGAAGAGLDNGGNEGADSASLQGGGLLSTAGGGATSTTQPGTSQATAAPGDVDYNLFGKLGMGGWTTAARKMAAKKSGAPA
jgi:hypothetical protein